MKVSRGTVVLDCTPEEFWKFFMGEAYQRAFYAEAIGALAFDLIECRDDSSKVRVVPKVNAPGPVKKLLGDRFAYENHGTLDRAQSTYTWRMVQPGNDDKKGIISMRGTIRVEPVGSTQCRRSDEVFIESKVFGVGSMMEAAAEKETEAARQREQPLMARFAKEASSGRT